MKIIKIYNGSSSILNKENIWINDGMCTQVTDMNNADIVLFHGWGNVSTSLRGVKNNSYGIYSPINEQEELEKLERAIELEKPIIGVERGMHLVSAKMGAQFVEHMQHPGIHSVHTYDGETFNVPSRHYQLVKPYKLGYNSYIVAAYAEGLSPIYLNNQGLSCLLRSTKSNKDEEIETIIYPEINALCFQFDPGIMGSRTKGRMFANDLVNMLLLGNIEASIRMREVRAVVENLVD